MPITLNAQFMSVPSGTTAQRPSPATVGMMRFNTDLNDYEVFRNNFGWSTLDTDLSPAEQYNVGGLPHQIIDPPGSTGLQGAGTFSSDDDAPSLNNSGSFGTHGGHSGSNSYPMYWAFHFNGLKRAINRFQANLHANSWGYFRLEGSNNSGVIGNWATNGTWTAIPFVSSNNGSNNQNMGGNSSGYSDGTILTFNYNNNTGYSAYRLVILDSSRPNQSLGTSFQGSANYWWRLGRA